MSILQQARAFVQQRKALAQRTAWETYRCPRCGSTITHGHGSYERHPWGWEGRETVRIARRRCLTCRRTYSETRDDLVRGSWYRREVHRCGIDLWVHGRMSLRRAAEVLRSVIGQQERWLLWQSLREETGERARCTLGASTLHRWLDRRGKGLSERMAGQWEEVVSSGQFAADGLWARLRGDVRQVVLLLTDTVTGLVWPPVVAAAEGFEAWGDLFWRARAAGLRWPDIDGLTSDGVVGLSAWLRQYLPHVHLQRCVWHLWRNLGAAFTRLDERRRGELAGLVRQVLDAGSWEAAQEALGRLAAHPQGSGPARRLRDVLEEALCHLLPTHQGLSRVAPEYLWRDFRLRLSRGRNHGSAQRLERAALLWAVYHNFTPAQWRCERKRHYKHPGCSPLEVAGTPPGEISYLDALLI